MSLNNSRFETRKFSSCFSLSNILFPLGVEKINIFHRLNSIKIFILLLFFIHLPCYCYEESSKTFLKKYLSSTVVATNECQRRPDSAKEEDFLPIKSQTVPASSLIILTCVWCCWLAELKKGNSFTSDEPTCSQATFSHFSAPWVLVLRLPTFLLFSTACRIYEYVCIMLSECSTRLTQLIFMFLFS